MIHPTNGKRLIQLLSITVFLGLLFVGAEDASSDEILSKGLIKGAGFCENMDNPEKAQKVKVKDLASFDITRTGLTDIATDIDILNKDLRVVETFALTGNILALNSKKGVFQLFGTSFAGTEMAVNGKYVEKNGTLKAVSGAFQAQNLDILCLTAGSFKAKPGPPPAPR